jgi:hypothetical protein
MDSSELEVLIDLADTQRERERGDGNDHPNHNLFSSMVHYLNAFIQNELPRIINPTSYDSETCIWKLLLMNDIDKEYQDRYL